MITSGNDGNNGSTEPRKALISAIHRYCSVEKEETDDNDEGVNNTGIQMKNISAKKFSKDISIDTVDTRDVKFDIDEV